jgi:hypothetical protein
MNPYLRRGGRLVAVTLFIAGAVFAVAAFAAILDAIPFEMSSGYHSWWAARADLRFALACAMLAGFCFWKCARLIREEKKGVQI